MRHALPQAALPITLYVPLLPRFSKRWVLIGILLFAALEASLILWCDRSLSQSLRVFDHTTPWLFAFFRAITTQAGVYGICGPLDLAH